MAKDSPSRSLDRIILRLPDGMRDRLSARAKANRRSTNAEVVLMLANLLDGTDIAEIDWIREEYARVNRQIKLVETLMGDMSQQRLALLQQLRFLAEIDAEGERPSELQSKAAELLKQLDRILGHRESADNEQAAE